MTKLLLAVLFVLVAMVLGLSVVLQPESAGPLYWGSIAWVVFLIIANWYTSAAIFSSDAGHKSGRPGSVHGILPATSIGTLIYSILSVGMLIAFNINFISHTFHLVSQIIFGAGVVIIVLLYLISAKGAEDGSEAVVSQSEMLNELRKLQRLKDIGIEPNEIKDLISYVAHRMPHPSKLDQDKLREAWLELQNKDNPYDQRIENFKSKLVEA